MTISYYNILWGEREYDLESESRKEAIAWAHERFAEEMESCVAQGEAARDTMELVYYEGEEEPVMVKKIPFEVEYEPCRSDFAEHNTYDGRL